MWELLMMGCIANQEWEASPRPLLLQRPAVLLCWCHTDCLPVVWGPGLCWWLWEGEFMHQDSQPGHGHPLPPAALLCRVPCLREGPGACLASTASL